MKLLILSNNLDRAGYRQRIDVYLDILKENAIQCKVVQLPSNYLSRWKLFKRAEDFDAVLLHKKGLNPLDAFCLKRYSKKIIYHFDDAIMYSPKNPESHSSPHFRSFRRSVKLADMVIAASSYLAKHALEFNPNVIVLPTGIKIGDYQSDYPHEKDDKIRIVWIGSSSTLDYLEQMKPIFEHIGTRFTNVVLRIIGDTFFDLENMEVEKRVWKKETRGIDLAQCDIGLAPLPDNRFTRGKCSFKVLEYSAAGLPVVASPIGTNQLHVCENITGFLAKDPEEWIDKISHLIKDEKLRRKMGDAGKQQARKFDRNVIGLKLCEIITEFVEGAKPIDIPSVAPPITAEPKVSICIPTYNRKDYLKETLDSIVAQTYKDSEIIVLDDGSTDGTEQMIKDTGYNIRYYWHENQGEPATCNKLIELAEAPYISFVHSDDLLFPDTIERLVAALKGEQEDVIAYGNYTRIDEHGNTLGRYKKELRSGHVTRYLFENHIMHVVGSLFPKKALIDLGGYDTSLRVCSDYKLKLQLSSKYRFIALDKPTFKRRRHTSNTSTGSFANSATELEVLKDFYYNDRGKELVPKKVAMKKISKECYRTARFAIKEGLYEQACQLLKQSFHYHPNIKSLAHWARAVINKKLRN